MTSTVTISVLMGTDPNVATIRKSTSSTALVVDLLGVETDNQDRPKRLYLRSKIHGKCEEVNYVGWELSGAISTILTRIDQGVS